MTAETNNLTGARNVLITTIIDGDAPVLGSFKLSFRGAITKKIILPLKSDHLAKEIENQLESLDTIEDRGVTVVHVSLPNGGEERVFFVEFNGEGVGGDVVPIQIVADDMRLYGSGANLIILADGNLFNVQNNVDIVRSKVGNVLSGFFRLKLRGHSTKDIPFNASAEQMKTLLEDLPNVGIVDVVRGPVIHQVTGYLSDLE